MIAGSNCLVDIWRITEDDDDIVGGAVITGTLQYQNVDARFQAEKTDLLILEQGLETIRIFTFLVFPSTMDVRERDEIEIVKPRNHTYFGNRFRIINVRYSDFDNRDPRNHIILHSKREERAKTRQ